MALCNQYCIPYISATEDHFELTVEEIREFYKSHNVHFYTNNNDVVYLGNGYIGLHSAEGGKKELRLPRPMRVRAVYGTEFSETVTDRIEFDLEENGTALFVLR